MDLVTFPQFNFRSDVGVASLSKTPSDKSSIILRGLNEGNYVQVIQELQKIRRVLHKPWEWNVVPIQITNNTHKSRFVFIERESGFSI